MKRTNNWVPYRNQGQVLPSAWIVDPKDRGRKKIYPGNKIYFKDGSEFMIELFNPLQDSVLAELKINNKLASSTGLILRPGERFYLDCFIDEKKKFIFKTYEVEASSPSVQQAIASNGNIEVNFYKEKVIPKPIPPAPLPHYAMSNTAGLGGNINYADYLAQNLDNSIQYSQYVADNSTQAVDYNAYMNLSTTAPSNIVVNTSTTVPNININIGVQGYQGSQGVQGVAGPQGTQGCQGSAGYSRSLKAKALSQWAPITETLVEETGRIEKGSKSDQQFVAIDMNFEYYAMHTIAYQMLPDSKRPLTTKEVKADAKNYCPNCGCRINPGDKFCRNCGHKLY